MVAVIARSASDEAIQNPDISKNRPVRQALMVIAPHACLDCFAPLAMTKLRFRKGLLWEKDNACAALNLIHPSRSNFSTKVLMPCAERARFRRSAIRIAFTSASAVWMSSLTMT